MKKAFILFYLMSSFCLNLFFISGVWSYDDGHEKHAYHVNELQEWFIDCEYYDSLDNTVITTENIDTPEYAQLHEIYLKLEYDGSSPSEDDFKWFYCKYGESESDMLQKFASECKISTNNNELIVSYGFINNPVILTEEDLACEIWLRGDVDIASIQVFVTYKYSGSDDAMPDFDRDEDIDLHTIDPEYTLEEVACLEIDDFQGMADSEKVIVMIHGWNPNENINHYGPEAAADWPTDDCIRSLEYIDADYDEDRNSFAFGHLMVNLMQNPAVEDKWTVARYNWANDAMTGSLGLIPDFTNPNASRDAAHVHGYKLGRLLYDKGVKKVHFIAHSAGNWVARRAAEYLDYYLGDSVTIQVTSLDPFVNDEESSAYGPSYNATCYNMVPNFELMSNYVDTLDNYYAVDGLFELDSDTIFGWTSGDFRGWDINQNIENLDGISSTYSEFMDAHAGPIYWYAISANVDESEDLKTLNLGFYNSLAWKEYEEDPGITHIIKIPPIYGSFAIPGGRIGPIEINHTNNLNSTVSFTIQPYYKENGVTTFLDSAHTGSIMADEDRSIYKSLNIPASQQPGTYTFGVKIDYFDSDLPDEDDSIDYKVW